MEDESPQSECSNASWEMVKDDEKKKLRTRSKLKSPKTRVRLNSMSSINDEDELNRLNSPDSLLDQLDQWGDEDLDNDFNEDLDKSIHEDSSKPAEANLEPVVSPKLIPSPFLASDDDMVSPGGWGLDSPSSLFSDTEGDITQENSTLQPEALETNATSDQSMEALDSNTTADGMVAANVAGEVSEASDIADRIVENDAVVAASEANAVTDQVFLNEAAGTCSETNFTTDQVFAANTAIDTSNATTDQLFPSDNSSDALDTNVVADQVFANDNYTKASETDVHVDEVFTNDADIEISELNTTADPKFANDASVEESHSNATADSAFAKSDTIQASISNDVADRVFANSTTTDQDFENENSAVPSDQSPNMNAHFVSDSAESAEFNFATDENSLVANVFSVPSDVFNEAEPEIASNAAEPSESSVNADQVFENENLEISESNDNADQLFENEISEISEFKENADQLFENDAALPSEANATADLFIRNAIAPSETTVNANKVYAEDAGTFPEEGRSAEQLFAGDSSGQVFSSNTTTSIEAIDSADQLFAHDTPSSAFVATSSHAFSTNGGTEPFESDAKESDNFTNENGPSNADSKTAVDNSNAIYVAERLDASNDSCVPASASSTFQNVSSLEGNIKDHSDTRGQPWMVEDRDEVSDSQFNEEKCLHLSEQLPIAHLSNCDETTADALFSPLAGNKDPELNGFFTSPQATEEFESDKPQHVSYLAQAGFPTDPSVVSSTKANSYVSDMSIPCSELDDVPQNSIPTDIPEFQQPSSHSEPHNTLPNGFSSNDVSINTTDYGQLPHAQPPSQVEVTHEILNGESPDNDTETFGGVQYEDKIQEPLAGPAPGFEEDAPTNSFELHQQTVVHTVMEATTVQTTVSQSEPPAASLFGSSPSIHFTGEDDNGFTTQLKPTELSLEGPPKNFSSNDHSTAENVFETTSLSSALPSTSETALAPPPSTQSTNPKLDAGLQFDDTPSDSANLFSTTDNHELFSTASSNFDAFTEPPSASSNAIDTTESSSLNAWPTENIVSSNAADCFAASGNSNPYADHEQTATDGPFAHTGVDSMFSTDHGTMVQDAHNPSGQESPGTTQVPNLAENEQMSNSDEVSVGGVVEDPLSDNAFPGFSAGQTNNSSTFADVEPVACSDAQDFALASHVKTQASQSQSFDADRAPIAVKLNDVPPEIESVVTKALPDDANAFVENNITLNDAEMIKDPVQAPIVEGVHDTTVHNTALKAQTLECIRDDVASEVITSQDPPTEAEATAATLFGGSADEDGFAQSGKGGIYFQGMDAVDSIAPSVISPPKQAADLFQDSDDPVLFVPRRSPDKLSQQSPQCNTGQVAHPSEENEECAADLFATSGNDDDYFSQASTPEASASPAGFDAPSPTDYETQAQYGHDTQAQYGYDQTSVGYSEGYNGYGNDGSAFSQAAPAYENSFPASPQQGQQYHAGSFDVNGQPVQGGFYQGNAQIAAFSHPQGQFSSPHTRNAHATSPFTSPHGNPNQWAANMHSPMSVNVPGGAADSTNSLTMAMSPTTASSFRDPSVKPHGCIVAFGFGGTMIAMFPKLKVKLNMAGGSRTPRGTPTSDDAGEPFVQKEQGSLRKGPILLYRMNRVLASDKEFMQMSSFPGPLMPQTSENTIQKIVDDHIAQLKNVQQDASDENLLWTIMGLFVKFKGNFRSDAGASNSESPEYAIMKLLRDTMALRKEQGIPGAEYDPIPTLPEMDQDELEAAKFKIADLLSQGLRKEAFEIAIASRQWAMAMLVSAFVDNESYTRAITEFSNSAFSVGDPLRTLCLALGGMMERSVHEPVLPDGPGQKILANWMENAAILVANANNTTNKMLRELGDRLWNETGSVTRAHVCYLMASVPPEAPFPQARIALIGSDHRSSNNTRLFASACAIQLTEICEWVYANLQGAAYPLLPFQSYKIVYAKQLADCGNVSQALSYVQCVIQAIQSFMAQNPTYNSAGVMRIQHEAMVFEDRLMNHLGIAKPQPIAQDPVQKPLGFMHKLLKRDGKNPASPDAAAQPEVFSPAPIAMQESFPPINTNAIPQHAPAMGSGGPARPGFPPMHIHGPHATDSAPPSVHEGIPSVEQGETATRSLLSMAAANAKEVRSKTPPASATKAPNSQDGQGWFTGIRSFVAEKMNPDAKVAKLGESGLAAVYDEELKKWIFPGEAGKEDAQIPDAPPTDMSMSSAAAPKSSPETGDDPLAALMAPPSLKSHLPPAPADPLSAMMAPPPRSTMRGPSTKSKRKVPPPTFKVFKPTS